MKGESRLTRGMMYRFIHRELVHLYGKDSAGRIISLAEKHYAACIPLCEAASRGEWMHLNNTILPTVSIYRALLEIDPEQALTSAHIVMTRICEAGGAWMRAALKLPGMRSVFMWLLPKIAKIMFGPSCGFRYENYEARRNALKMDMIVCPYCRYAALFEAPELTPVFCDSDFAVYGNLPGIRFERTQTLGSGSDRCDFRFSRTNLLKR